MKGITMMIREEDPMDDKETNANKESENKKFTKDLLMAILVTAVGFVLLNLTFMFYAGVHNLVSKLIRSMMHEEPQMEGYTPYVIHGVCTLAVFLVSWLASRLKLHVALRAAILMVPLATSLVVIGIFFYEIPALAYALGAAVCLSLLGWLYLKKKHWLYMYSVVFVGIAILLMNLFGVEI